MKQFALVGNPNSGKTTLFNLLTGSSQHTGNWPGVTVEKKDGKLKKAYGEAEIIDLPGIYSLSPYSPEEVVSREFITQEKPDVVIDIVDATNIERNLYLALQLLELEVPVVIALNMMDEIRKRGDEIDVDALSRELGVPVIPISAVKGENIEKLIQVASSAPSPKPINMYGEKAEALILEATQVVHQSGFDAMPAKWTAMKLLENDQPIVEKVALSPDATVEIDGIRQRLESDGQATETLLADGRYRYIGKIVHDSVKKGREVGILTTSDKIDRVVTNRWLAIPIFLVIMWLMFTLTFSENLFGLGIASPGVWLQGLAESFVSWVGSGVGSLLTQGSWVYSLVVDGVIGGVGSVISFIPQILFIFLFLTILEDIGYMSRAAFVMDRIFRKFGLSGKSFIPMLMGFGCTVPAVMAARTIENEQDRKLTIFVTPFISCGARAPIFAVFTAAFFPYHADLVVMGLYIGGIVLAFLSAIVFKKLLFKGASAPFIMELPPYRPPRFMTVLLTLWDKFKGYIYRAGTIIFAMTVVIWVLSNFNWSFQMVSIDDSILASIGHAIAPIFAPLGFGTWKATVSLITGFVAKEAVISTMGVLYGIGETASISSFHSALVADGFTVVSSLAFMVFSLLYVPCVAAVAAIKKEYNSWKWTFAQMAYGTGLGWVLGMIIYQVGSLLKI